MTRSLTRHDKGPIQSLLDAIDPTPDYCGDVRYEDAARPGHGAWVRLSCLTPVDPS